LIEQAELAFDGGLSVLSGETGAGKSILLDALGLALGARADSALVRRGEAGGMVSAEFDIAGRSDIKHVLAELGLEADDQIIIRRSLSSDGKTRALVNDQPVTVTALKKLGELLIEIHGQHDQRGLQDRSVHRDLLDGFGKLGTERTKVAGCYGAWRECMRAVAALEAEITQAEREQDYLNHMRGELKALNPKAGEEESLSDQRTRMMQSEKLFDVLNEAMNELSSPSPMSQRVRSVLRTLTRSPLTSSESFASALDALDKAACLLDEAQESLEAIGREASFDPVKLEAIEERLFALKAAGRKYNLPVEELVLLKEQVNDKLALLAAQAERLASLRKKESEARKSLIEAATNLSEKRRIVATRLEKAVMSELKPLKMDGTKFHVKIEMQSEEHWSEAGLDIVEFTCATNVTKGEKAELAPLSKIASGGELSRFMLAMKVALAGGSQTATMIFDEIDTGTGGAVADAIGARLAALAKEAQVLVVTHLPQVAARGAQHIKVSKQEKSGKVTTSVKTLSAKEREEELARMLAGATITPEARKAAQKLLEQAA
jgi:DNA repair protein RecN (Recombination protein N)